MVICLVALPVFAVMSLFSAKYKKLAKDAFRCFTKTLTLSPCDVGLERWIKGKAVARLMWFPALSRLVYRHFKIVSWAFTVAFFASLAYTVYSFYNLFVYGSCEPGGVCYLTWIGSCILAVEQWAAQITLLVLAGIIIYVIVGHYRHH